MLRDAGDDVVAALTIELGHALDGQVVAFGRTGREHNLLGAGVDQLGYTLARSLNSLFG